ncbi:MULTISPECIES: hypothetical protein [Mycobacteriales]|jgi:hypothetical protein|uniref:Uncharacterized protein n=1 Tax=Gordonia rubripertincta TaxID=36822 RepID=A0ABT4MWV9_GORRU|nr:MULTISPECIES: hypothetical protein [Mycobacteriales]MBA4023241.1 hypothetical protein [Gordonia sp. (in: high G+C Gram-positive bacteria)]MCZ4551498.1 hypothetical protein [Gordonia rubripertincta]ORM26827.1 hypothetical protein BFL43_22350 [Williamsia sp. 1135]OZG26195.1 hypothetical protein BH683_025665 [Williamsia sp. 1138]
MHGLAVLLFPAVLMLFALAMERVENQLERLNVRVDHVEEFLESAEPEQMDTLARQGFPAALDEFRDRRMPTNIEPGESIRAS